jgi:hypothetical protein
MRKHSLVMIGSGVAILLLGVIASVLVLTTRGAISEVSLTDSYEQTRSVVASMTKPETQLRAPTHEGVEVRMPCDASTAEVDQADAASEGWSQVLWARTCQGVTAGRGNLLPTE